MTFGETYKELISLGRASDASLGYYAKMSVNRAISWAIRQLDFVRNEKSETLIYDSTSVTNTLPSDCLHLVAASLGDIPIEVVSEGQLVERKRKYYDGQSATVPINYAQTFASTGERPVLSLGGNYYFISPPPSSNTTLTLLYQQTFTDLTEDSGEHFLLSEASDMIMLRCLCSSPFRARLSPEVANLFPIDLFAAEWDNVVKWNASLRSNQFRIS